MRMLNKGFVPILILAIILVLGFTAGVYYLETRTKQAPKPSHVLNGDITFEKQVTPSTVPINHLKEQIRITYKKVDIKVVDALNTYSQAKIVVSLYDPVAINTPLNVRIKAIAKVQDSVLNKLYKEDFAVIYKYDSVPGLVGTAYTKHALDVFENSVEVRSVGLDLPAKGLLN